MSTQPAPQEGAFSDGAIKILLEKICRHPVMEESSVLKKFLAFIIDETIQGRSLYLKEYTIARNV